MWLKTIAHISGRAEEKGGDVETTLRKALPRLGMESTQHPMTTSYIRNMCQRTYCT